MARLHPETTLSHLPLDVAITPDLKTGVAPSLLGAFDEALRQARQPERDPVQDPAASARETRPVDESRPSSQTSEREDHETDEASSDCADAAPVSEAESRPSEEVETDEAETESQPTSEESAEDAEVEDDGVPSDEAATDAEATVKVPAEELTVGEIERASEGEQVSSGENAVETSEKTVGTEATGTQSIEATIRQSSGDSGVDESAITTEAIDETVEGTQEDPGEEPESDSKQKTAEVENQKATEALDKSGVDSTNSLDEPVNDAAVTSSKDLGEPPPERAAKGEEESTRGEKHEAAAAQSNDAQVTAADAVRPVQATAGAVESQLENTLVASDVPPVAETAAADTGVTSNAPQSTGSADVMTLVESRVSAAQSQADAGTAKGTEQGVEPAKFVQRVAKAFVALGQRSGPVRLKLYPPELGSLRMEITVKNGTLNARVEAETAAAKSVLLENLPLLRERLAEQGVKVDRFDVGVSDQSQGGPSERSDDGGRSSQRSGRDADSRASAKGDDAEVVERPRERPVGADGRLDVLI